METIKASEDIDHARRRFFGAAALTIATAQLGMMGSSNAQTKTSQAPAVRPGTNTSFASLKQINAGLLDVGYAEVGPADGPPVILLHGWPYDIHSYVDVAPSLASAGYRVIVPYTRGYGTTRFLSSETSAIRWKESALCHSRACKGRLPDNRPTPAKGRHRRSCRVSYGQPVPQNYRRAIGRSDFRVTDVQQAGVNLLQRSKGRVGPRPAGRRLRRLRVRVRRTRLFWWAVAMVGDAAPKKRAASMVDVFGRFDRFHFFLIDRTGCGLFRRSPTGAPSEAHTFGFREL